MFRYKVVEIFTYRSSCKFYGIRAEAENKNGWSTIGILTNISNDRDLVFCLADKSTKLQIEPSSLFKIVLDIRH